MIPEKLVEFLHGAAFMGVGTRDERLRPHHTWAIGALVANDRQGITAFLPIPTSGRTLENLHSNGKIAMGAGVPQGNATYQFKGTFVSERPCNEKDHAVQELYLKKLLRGSVEAGYPEELMTPIINGFVYKPSIAVTFSVEEIYDQTPGPDAGKRIS